MPVAPHRRNAFTLTCELTTAQRGAILVAHGGASTGFALHLSAGKLIWAIRHGKTRTTAQTDYPADNQPRPRQQSPRGHSHREGEV